MNEVLSNGNTALAVPGELEQGVLFEAGAELLSVEERAKSGRYSGVIIERDRGKVRAIVQALAEGHGIIRVARAFGVSEHTVIGIRERHPDLIAMEKKNLSKLLGRVVAVGWEQYLEAVVDGRVSPRDLPVGLGIAGDKKALIDGEVTQRIEVRQADTVESVLAGLECLRQVAAERLASGGDDLAVKEAVVVEVSEVKKGVG